MNKGLGGVIMVNNINKVVYFNVHEEYNYISEEEKSNLGHTQKRLKSMANNELLLDVTKTVARAMEKGMPVVGEMCRTINQHYSDGWMSFSNSKSEERMAEFNMEIKFINTIKLNEDFVCAYVLKEEINTIWVIIKDSTFKFKKKYLQHARVFRENNKSEFNLIVFEEEQLDEIQLQLNYVEGYEVCKK